MQVEFERVALRARKKKKTPGERTARTRTRTPKIEFAHRVFACAKRARASGCGDTVPASSCNTGADFDTGTETGSL